MKINRQVVLSSVLSIISFCSIGFGIFYYRYIFSVDKYAELAMETYPFLDRLNLRVFVDTPPPKDVTLTNLYVGVSIPEASHLYGRAVEAEYQTNLTSTEIINYYENLLKSLEWEKLDDYESFPGSKKQIYVQGTGCIKIDTLSGSQDYTIKIWHDFWSQDFSPQKNLWAIKEIQSMGGGFVTCPP